jgi:sulfide dehydrogenase cytochrome subunit
MSDFFISDNMAVYRDKARPCPEVEYVDGPDKGSKTDMCKVAADLSDDDIEALAKYFSGKPFVRAKQEFDSAKAEIGQKIHDRHCEKCHADGGSSAEDDAGILAGQWTPYLKQAFEEYSSGEREMPKKMKPKFEKLDADEKEALLQYYASFQ